MLARWTAALITVGFLALPTSALANAYTQVQGAYTTSGTGQIAACQFSSAELETALAQAPSYSFQYQSDFTDAVQAALAARANGDCVSGGTAPAVAKSALGPSARLDSADTRLPTSLTAAGSGGLPLVLVVGFGLVGLFLLGLTLWFGFNAVGADPRVLRAARQSLHEAEYRIGAGWEDLTDRLRR
jgi:hypothetical protein